MNIRMRKIFYSKYMNVSWKESESHAITTPMKTYWKDKIYEEYWGANNIFYHVEAISRLSEYENIIIIWR